MVRRDEMRRALIHVLRIAIGVTLLVVLPWRWVPPPTSAFMLGDRVTGTTVHHRWVGWEKISPRLAVAVVASEDQKFPTHHGFDFDSIAKAWRDTDGRRRGASTISQQVVKNLYLWPGRSVVRKAIEAYLTGWIELLWPKRRILEIYLNIAEFGPGVYGAEAAAERLFGTSARALTVEQATLLAAVLPNPTERSAARPSASVRRRARAIQTQMRRLGGTAYLDAL